ncbi:hypothetical protein EDD16DRAFT_1518167 [Pisolithus croceorrhizus]|nr:hypothetical protein EDD16DRAFT_1518167 [Pisolithus croceorrhizus]
MENPGSPYKKLKTARGYTYNYISVKGQAGRPTLLFMHGFPDTSHGWHHQISYFRTKAMDWLFPICWGVVSITSILSIKHSERFLGFVFIAVPYSVQSQIPARGIGPKEQERVFGRPAIGYWTFLTKDQCSARDRETLEGRRLASANYLPEIYREQLKNLLLPRRNDEPVDLVQLHGTRRQRRYINGLQPEDLLIRRPTLMAFAKFDYVAIENYVRSIMHQHTPPELLSEREYDTGHWIHLEDPSRFNNDLEQWIETSLQSI